MDLSPGRRSAPAMFRAGRTTTVESFFSSDIWHSILTEKEGRASTLDQDQLHGCCFPFTSCHPERSEGSGCLPAGDDLVQARTWILRFARDGKFFFVLNLKTFRREGQQ